MKRRHRVAIGTVWLAALAGCGRGSARDARFVDRPPEDLSWLEGRPELLFPRDRYFVGVGTCGPEVSGTERMDCAIHRALAQAVAMVRQHVRVQVRRHTQLDRKAGSDGSEAFVRSTFEHDGVGQSELTVADVAPRRRLCTSDGRCHALVALDRAALAARSAQKIAQLQAQIDELLDRAEKGDSLTAIEQLSAASRLASGIDHEAELLSAAAGPSAVPPSAWNRWFAVRSKRFESLVVCLSSNASAPAAQLVFSRAHQDLSARGFARVSIARTSDCPANALSLTFDGATLERAAEDHLWVFEVRGTVVLRASMDTLGKGVPVLGRGVARVREQARSEAEDDLAMNVQQSVARLLDPAETSAP